MNELFVQQFVNIMQMNMLTCQTHRVKLIKFAFL